MTYKLWVVLGVVSLSISCSPKLAIVKSLRETENKFQNHTGFYLFDPSTQKTLIDFNGSHYFTPASNTKIFTLYTSLKVLGDTLTGFYYQQKNDSLILWGSGDPSFLYPYVYQNNNVYSFLKNSPQKIFLSNVNDDINRLGPGWAWSDYQFAYSSERSAFPMYGNLIQARTASDSAIHTRPAVFMEHIAYSAQRKKTGELVREIDSNMLTYFPGEIKTEQKWIIPFRSTTDLLAELLTDTLKRPVEEITIPRTKNALRFPSIPADSVYKVMMQESDNFIAEQLLLMCAAAVSDTLNSEIGIDYAIKNLLTDLPDKPIWADGSGLSRYNLFTPRSIVKLWEKISQEVPQEKLFQLLAVGGKSGTIRNWYKAEVPFIYAKTGTLSNNHCLSGFLITKKGKVLLFSFMNNNFTTSGNAVRKEMEKVLFSIRDRY